MKFSLLIAHYNNERYFKDCYESILNQSYQDFEVIILDDYSNINSYNEVVNLIKNDSRFLIYRNDKNEGVGFTKNKLIELACGEVCAFLDPDDALDNSALDEIIKVFYSDLDAVAVYSRMFLTGKSLELIKPFNRACQVINNDRLFVNISTNIAHFFAFKKEVIFSFSPFINPNLKSAVDQDLYLKLYEKGKFIFIDKCLYFYRLHDNGVSQSVNKVKAKDDFKNVIKDTFKRRNISKLGNHNINELSDDEIYNFLVKRESSLLMKFKRFLCKL